MIVSESAPYLPEHKIRCDFCQKSITTWSRCFNCKWDACQNCLREIKQKFASHTDQHILKSFKKHYGKQNLRAYKKQWNARLRKQGGGTTFFDNFYYPRLRLLKEWRHEANAFSFFNSLRRRQGQGRYIDFFSRKSDPGMACHVQNFMSSQGIEECLTWKSKNLFKTTYDFAIYSMLLWELKPKTVIEVGSGAGTSAIWFSDLSQIFKIKTQVISIDLKKPPATYPNVTFLKGDCKDLRKVLKAKDMKGLPHPWLIVEDAHVNTKGVLEFFHKFLKKNDYFIVEDSAGKADDIALFMVKRHKSYLVDTRYTDFFGHNSTCAENSIFKKI